MQALVNFGDPSVIDEILPLLEDSNNYVFYENIVEMILDLDAMPNYEAKLRQVSFQAMENERELTK